TRPQRRAAEVAGGDRIDQARARAGASPGYPAMPATAVVGPPRCPATAAIGDQAARSTTGASIASPVAEIVLTEHDVGLALVAPPVLVGDRDGEGTRAAGIEHVAAIER